MYSYKINKETKKLELVTEMMNVHPSIIDTKKFDAIFTREYARFEYFQLLAKIDNGTNTTEDFDKYELLIQSGYDFGRTECTCDLSDCNVAIKPLMILTLFAHGKLLRTYTKNDDGKYVIKAEKMSLGLNDFYKACRNTVIEIENGETTIEDAIKVVKPLYNEAIKIINHEAVEGVCKKWEDSTKEKVTRAFITGLLSRYKLTRSNRIKTESPLKSLPTFEKYFAMWLVTNGKMLNSKKQFKQTVETFQSICNRK